MGHMAASVRSADLVATRLCTKTPAAHGTKADFEHEAISAFQYVSARKTSSSHWKRRRSRVCITVA